MPAPKEIDPDEVFVNRFNVKDASRSANALKLLQLSGLRAAEDEGLEDEDDFEDVGETGVLGFKLNNTGDISDAIRLQRTSNSKLLENIMGKKEAEAHRKMQASKHSTSKPMEKSQPKAVQRVDEDDDEDEGRAAAVSSKGKKRKARDNKTPAYTAGGQADSGLDEAAEPPDPREDTATVKELATQDKSEVEETQRPKKRKAGSYLDEILAKSAKKKKKKNKGKAQ